MESGPRRIEFDLADLDEQLEAFGELWPTAVADDRSTFFGETTGSSGEGARLVPPLLGPPVAAGETLTQYRRRLAALPGGDPVLAVSRHAIVLVRAAGVAIGYWDGDELLRHKAIRKYVVRGKGRAQPTHLKTRGKSRYGSRLRLQNWRSLLSETNARLTEYWNDLGAPERIFVSVPVRVFTDLAAADPPPPFRRDDPEVVRLPIHVHRPDHAELLRVRRWLRRGRVELPTAR